MLFALLVTSTPFSGQGAATAARFAHTLIEQGHELSSVFFLDAGVENGAANAVCPQDESDILGLWIELAEQHQVELTLCIASALRHGMLDEAEAERYERAATVHPAFSIGGLGQLVDANAKADRVITFGGQG
ncbi:MAG: sulfurtransferase complex subunit TusD [Pseudomonadota bacterium]